jgi:DHA2 family multidrug resistance protein-like MFS transporter
MLPVDLLVKPLFSLSLGAALCSFAAQMMTLVSLPFFFNYQLGLSEVAIGLLFIVWPLSVMFTAVAAGRLADHYPAGILGGIGLTLGACGLFLLYRLQADAQLADIIWRLFVCGAGFGLFQTPNMRFIVSTSPHHRTGSVSGMIGTVRLSGQTIGASLSALMLHLFREDHGQSALVLAASITLFAALLSSLRLSSHWANRP